MFPGTKMACAGIKDEQKIKDLIAARHLRQCAGQADATATSDPLSSRWPGSRCR